MVTINLPPMTKPAAGFDGARDGLREGRSQGELGCGARPHAPVTRRPSALRLGPLVAVMFFTVSGGPFGLEGVVGSVGTRVAALLLVAAPLFFKIPDTVLLGEL